MSEDCHDSNNVPDFPDPDRDSDSNPDPKKQDPKKQGREPEPEKIPEGENKTLVNLCKGKGTLDDANVFIMGLEQHLTDTVRTCGFNGMSQESTIVIHAIIASIGNFFALMERKYQNLGIYIFGFLYATYLKFKIEMLKFKVNEKKDGKGEALSQEEYQKLLDSCLYSLKVSDGWEGQ